MLQGVANRLNAGSKRVYRVDRNAQFSDLLGETALAAEFNRIAAIEENADDEAPGPDQMVTP